MKLILSIDNGPPMFVIFPDDTEWHYNEPFPGWLRLENKDGLDSWFNMAFVIGVVPDAKVI